MVERDGAGVARAVRTAAAAVAGAALVLLGLLPDGSPGSVGVALTIELVSLGVFLVVAIGMPRRARLVWWLLAASLTVVAAGDVIYDVMLYHFEVEPFPSWPDVLYFAAYVPQMLALVLLIVRRQRVWDLAAWIDSAIITAAALAVAVAVVLVPMLDTAAEASALVAFAYPVCDLVVLALLVRLTVGGGRPMAAVVLIAASVALSLFADLTYNALAAGGSLDESPAWLNALFAAGPVLMAFAITAPGATGIGRPATGGTAMISPTRMVALGVSALVGPVLIAVQALDGSSADTFPLAALTVAVNALLVGRVLLLLATVRGQAEQLDEIARTDALTGLPNRRSWDFTIARTAAVAGGRRVAVAVADIDHFKEYNDEHGHVAGDALLAACAVAWRAALPDSAFLARYGGEEFTVLIAEDAPATCVEMLDRMRRATPAPATVSIGVASSSAADPPGLTFDRADAALYRAKADGRDRVVSWTPGTDRPGPTGATATAAP